MIEYLKTFFEEFDYPQGAREELLRVHCKIWDNNNLQNYIKEYEKHHKLKWNEAMEEMTRLAENVGESFYTVHLLFFIYLTVYVKDLYEKRGLPYNLYKDTFTDLKYKLQECYKMYGVWGVFTDWFDGFYELNRFALGRLQYEIHTFDLDMEYKGIKKGDTVINVHIPSSGPLTPEVVADSFAQAYEFYKDLFPDGVVPFVCDSWLLYPEHKKFLPRTSNILKFMDNFEIIRKTEDKKFGDCWRIFYKNYDGNPDNLPTDTSLQRAYVEWLKWGAKAGYGYGIMFYKK